MDRRKRGRGHSRAVLLLALVLMLSLAACGGSDRPPDSVLPPPPPLKGTYSAEQGSLSFNGDGRSVTLKLSGELARASGLPEGESQGTFVFLFRNEEWRYDKAETFRVMIGDKTWNFRNAPDRTGEKTVAVYLTDGTEPVVFQKEG